MAEYKLGMPDRTQYRDLLLLIADLFEEISIKAPVLDHEKFGQPIYDLIEEISKNE